MIPKFQFVMVARYYSTTAMPASWSDDLDNKVLVWDSLNTIAKTKVRKRNLNSLSQEAKIS